MKLIELTQNSLYLMSFRELSGKNGSMLDINSYNLY